MFLQWSDVVMIPRIFVPPLNVLINPCLISAAKKTQMPIFFVSEPTSRPLVATSHASDLHTFAGSFILVLSIKQATPSHYAVSDFEVRLYKFTPLSKYREWNKPSMKRI